MCLSAQKSPDVDHETWPSEQLVSTMNPLNEVNEKLALLWFESFGKAHKHHKIAFYYQPYPLVLSHNLVYIVLLGRERPSTSATSTALCR